MVRRRDSSSELTPEDFLESRQDDSDSPNPVLDILRNVDAVRDEDGTDGEGMPGGVRSATLTESNSEVAWDTGQTEKDGEGNDSNATSTANSPDAGSDDDDEPEWEPETESVEVLDLSLIHI